MLDGRGLAERVRAAPGGAGGPGGDCATRSTRATTSARAQACGSASRAAMPEGSAGNFFFGDHQSSRSAPRTCGASSGTATGSNERGALRPDAAGSAGPGPAQAGLAPAALPWTDLDLRRGRRGLPFAPTRPARAPRAVHGRRAVRGRRAAAPGPSGADPGPGGGQRRRTTCSRSSRQDGGWGAIARSNYSGLRFREAHPSPACASSCSRTSSRTSTCATRRRSGATRRRSISRASIAGDGCPRKRTSGTSRSTWSACALPHPDAGAGGSGWARWTGACSAPASSDAKATAGVSRARGRAGPAPGRRTTPKRSATRSRTVRANAITWRAVAPPRLTIASAWRVEAHRPDSAPAGKPRLLDQPCGRQLDPDRPDRGRPAWTRQPRACADGFGLVRRDALGS